MICDDVELSLSCAPGELSVEARAHLSDCARCRAFEADAREVVALAAMPRPGPEVRAQLVGLGPRVLAGWARRAAWQGRSRRALGYALAACVGALLASGLWWPARRASPERPLAPQAGVAPLLADEPVLFAGTELSDEDLNVAPEEVFFEVTWPSPEGEVL